MTNISEQFENYTLDILSPLSIQFCLKESPTGYIVWYCMASLCFLIGTPAHLWCLWFYFYTEPKIKETQVFWLNHTIIELVYCLECGLEILGLCGVTNLTLWSVVYFCFGLSWTGRPLLQICICIEQYLAVLHPVTFLNYKAIKYRIVPAVATWLLASVYGVYVTMTLVFPDFIFTSVFIIALAVVLFCCVSVLCALKQSGPGDKHKTKQPGKDGGNQQKRNAFNMIFSTLLLILFTYLPQALLIFFTDNGVDRILLDCNIVPFMVSFNVLGVVITPLVKLYKQIHIKYHQNKSKATP